MCGIAGVVSADPSRRSAAALRAMLSAVAHRGPDDEGIAERGAAAIGARRLAIIDLERGHQPMADESGDVLAVQNGEIYNYRELRTELAGRGHRFDTDNDTEILPHAYEEWGDDLVTRLRGMFALAIWDARRGRLLLARDRFGKKPLFYARVGEDLLFGSEIQALLAHPAVARDVDAGAIREYLTLGYVRAPRSAFAAIRKVAPAHALVHEGGRVETRRYWQLSYVPKLRMSMDDAAAELRDRMDEAVRIRLRSDVPLGAFLSGGLDSSAVVAFMARHSQRPVRTFSIGFRDQAYDESAYARVVARAFGTDHTELVVDAADASVLPTMARHLGEPFADSSIVPTYHVARITREHVTVALNGDGGDELFAGYDRYRAAMLVAGLDRLPRSLVRGVAAVAARTPMPAALPRAAHRARRFLLALGLPPDARHLRWIGYFTGPLLKDIAGERLPRSDGEWPQLLREASTITGAVDPAERFMASDVLHYLPGDLLVKMDIATMANSLEARSPLLDHELAEFMARLPVSFKTSPGRSKLLLRHAMRGILPERILGRGKMGFGAPIGSWLRGPLRGMLGDLVLSSAAAKQGFVRAEAVRTVFDEHMSGRADRTLHLWNLLMLELWFRECVLPVPSRL